MLRCKIKIAFACLALAIIMLGQGCRSTRSNSDPLETVGGNNGDPAARQLRLSPFKSDAEVRYCLNLGPDVTGSKINFAQQIESAFASWQNYLAQHDVNAILSQDGGRRFPKGFHLVDSCADATVQFYIGSEVGDQELQFHLATRTRDSAISGIFSSRLDLGPHTLVWIAGPGIAPMPLTNDFPADILRRFDLNQHGAAKELGAVLRHLIGGLFGNVRTLGGIMEMLPEQLIECYRAGDEKCIRRVEGGIDDEYQLMTTDSHGRSHVSGCFLGSGPVPLIVRKDHFTIGSEDPVWSSNWRAAPSVQSNQREVFAMDARQRTFFEQKLIEEFRNVKVGDADLVVYESVRINTGNVRASVSLRCPQAEELLFLATDAECPTPWQPELIRERLQAIMERCR